MQQNNLTSPDMPAVRGTSLGKMILGRRTFYAWRDHPDNRCEHVHVTRHAAMICARSL